MMNKQDDLDFLRSAFEKENITAPESLSESEMLKKLGNVKPMPISSRNKILQRVIATAACFAFVVTAVYYGIPLMQEDETAVIAPTKTTEKAERSTAKKQKKTQKKTHKYEPTVKKTVSGSTAKKTMKKTNGTISSEIPTALTKYKKKKKPTLPKTIPGASSTVASAIPRTTDKDGNPTPAFINSCKGFTLKIIDPWEGPALGSPLYESAAYVEQMIEAEFAVTVEQSGFSEGYDTALSASLASGNPQAHIYRVSNADFAKFVDKNYLCDLNAAMKKSGVDFKSQWYNEDAIRFFNINNQQLAWSEWDNAQHVIYYNKELIEKEKLTDPHDLVRKGTWTWDTMAEYSKLGFVVADDDPTTLFKGMVASHGKSVTKIKSGYAPTTNINDSTVKSSLTTLQNWITSGQVTFSPDHSSKDDFASGDAAMIYGDRSALDYVSKFKIGVVPFPKPNKVQIKYYSYNSVDYPYFIPSTHKTDAAKILFLYNEMGRQGYRFLLRDFVIENMRTFGGGDLDMLTEIYAENDIFKATDDFSGFCEIGSATTSSVVDSVVKGMPAQDAIDTHIADIESAYESVWGDKKITG